MSSWKRVCWTSNTRSRRCLDRKERNLGRREKTTIIEEEKRDYEYHGGCSPLANSERDFSTLLVLLTRKLAARLSANHSLTNEQLSLGKTGWALKIQARELLNCISWQGFPGTITCACMLEKLVCISHRHVI